MAENYTKIHPSCLALRESATGCAFTFGRDSEGETFSFHSRFLCRKWDSDLALPLHWSPGRICDGSDRIVPLSVEARPVVTHHLRTGIVTPSTLGRHFFAPRRHHPRQRTMRHQACNRHNRRHATAHHPRLSVKENCNLAELEIEVVDEPRGPQLRRRQANVAAARRAHDGRKIDVRLLARQRLKLTYKRPASRPV